MMAPWPSAGIFDGGHWIWCLVIGGLIVVWILVGITNLGVINKVAMAALLCSPWCCAR